MHKDEVRLIAGGRGMGKSSYLRSLMPAGRRLVWDPTGDYAGDIVAESLYQLAATCSQPGFTGGVVYRPQTLDDFDGFCRIAWAWGDCYAVVDELAAVTPPGKANGWWGRLVREGRHRGIRLMAATQRVAETDKTILGNATHLVCFRLQRRADRLMMAAELDIPVFWLDALRPMEYYARAMAENGPVVRGRLTRE